MIKCEVGSGYIYDALTVSEFWKKAVYPHILTATTFKLAVCAILNAIIHYRMIHQFPQLRIHIQVNTAIKHHFMN